MSEDRPKSIDIALRRYQKGAVGMRGAAALADRTIGEMMTEANERNVLSNYDVEDLTDDIDALR